MAGPLVLGRIVSMALTFALPLLLARRLDASAFGTYKQLFLVAQTVLLTCQLGLTQSLYYFLPREREGRGAYVGQVVLLLGALAVCAGFLLAIASPLIARHLGSGDLALLAAPLALLAAGMLAAAPLEAALTSDGRVGLAGLTYVLSDGTRAALLLLGARHGGLAGLAWGGALWALLRVVGLAAAIVAGAIPIGRPRRLALRRQLAYALPFAGSVFLYVAQKQFLQYAVASRASAAAFALFSVAAFHLPVVDILYTPIADVLMVKLGQSRGEKSAARLHAWDDAVEKLASLLWPAAVCAWLFGPLVLPLLFTERYRASVPLFMISTAEIPLWVFPVDALLRAAGRTRFLFGWYGARVVMTGAFVLAGMRISGMAGAIVGGIASEAVSRIVMVAAGRPLLGVSLGRALHPALLGVGFAALVAAVPALVVRGLASGVMSVVWGGATYLSSYALLRFALSRRRRPAMSTAIAS